MIFQKAVRCIRSFEDLFRRHKKEALTTDMNGGATAPSVNTYNGVGTLRLYAD